MGNRQGIPVHLIRKNGLRVEDFIERQDLVIREGRVLRLRKRMEDNVTRLWQGTAHFQDCTHPYPSPFRHGRPSLNTIMFGDLLLLGERPKVRQGQRQRPFHQPADGHAPLYKLCLSLLLICLGFGRVPIHPKVRRNLLFGVVLPGPHASEQEPHEWFYEGCGVDLKSSLIAQRIHGGPDMKENDPDQSDRSDPEGESHIRVG